MFAAGNDDSVTYPNGLYAGYDKLTYYGTAKNNLVIANANPIVAEQQILAVITSLLIALVVKDQQMI